MVLSLPLAVVCTSTGLSWINIVAGAVVVRVMLGVGSWGEVVGDVVSGVPRR